jgi:hypothetical protein
MKTILQALLGWVFGALTDWIAKRQAAKAEAAAMANRAGAVQDSQAQRVRTEQAVEQSHVATDASRERLQHIAAGGDPRAVLRDQSIEVGAAIDRANGDLQ